MPFDHEPGLSPRDQNASSHTFVFADLVGFTSLADLEGDDRALEVAREFQRQVRALLKEHGAEYIKALGDGLMLRLSDPRAAILLGVRLIGRLAAESDFPPVRAGIHTGPALSSDGDWYGRTVNVAARLCALAPAGGVMVSDRTRAAGEIDGIDWGSRQLRRLRNVTAPVGTYLACALEKHGRSAQRKQPAPRRLGWFRRPTALGVTP